MDRQIEEEKRETEADRQSEIEWRQTQTEKYSHIQLLVRWTKLDLSKHIYTPRINVNYKKVDQKEGMGSEKFKRIKTVIKPFHSFIDSLIHSVMNGYSMLVRLHQPQEQRYPVLPQYQYIRCFIVHIIYCNVKIAMENIYYFFQDSQGKYRCSSSISICLGIFNMQCQF